ncbi:MAG: hypothetical protein NDI84_08005 [Steroidobacteraceae bacterium]|nr:hypothetical protein [Steroidobacteraceae bacterium]
MKSMYRVLAATLFAVVSVLASLPASAGAMSDYLEGKLLDHVFKATAYSGPATTYVGLSTTACSDSSTGTEVTGGSYARVSVTSNGTNWTGPTGNNGTIANGAAITFPAPTANWGSVSHWFIADASSAGNVLVCASLTASKTINNGDAAPSFGVGAMTFQIDN